MKDIELKAINAIRALAIDATTAAGSGHPGMPLGTAAMAYVLWQKFLNHNPRNPQWFNRDRFVQSAGHGSTLSYSLLHLTGYDLSVEEIRNHRQYHSLTPGHPETGHTPGVETTTGPLGQGISTAVGMALAEAHLAATYNKPDCKLVDHYTYVIASDGDLMEGVSSEASSLAGHFGLSKLIVLYDDNNITIDGSTEIAFTEDVLKRYEAYGWHTQQVLEGNDTKAIEATLQIAKEETRKPSLISVKTIIGYGSPLEGTPAIHGKALKSEQALETKAKLGIDWPEFSVPEDVQAHYHEAINKGEQAETTWLKQLESYQQGYPELAVQFKRVLSGEIPNIEDKLPSYEVGSAYASRNTSGEVINALTPQLPELVGGSADLAGSNITTIKNVPFMKKQDFSGRNIHFGVREHGMAAIANGLALHGGVRPYVATFLIFADYLRPSLRLAALMKQPVIYVLTHDSIGLGGDGPTHQPVAQLMSLRAIPNVTVIRPADANETARAWSYALNQKETPTVLALSRQNLPTLKVPKDSVSKGAYIIADCEGQAEVILIATGSEVAPSLAAKDLLAKEGMKVRVVSMPSFEIFETQDEAYKQAVLPNEIRARVAIEAGASLGWQKYVGLDGAMITLDTFGASGDGDKLMEVYGFTAENIARVAKQIFELTVHHQK